MLHNKDKAKKPDLVTWLGVRIEPEQRQELKKIAQAEDRPFSRVVRQAINEFIIRKTKAQA